MCDPRGSHGSRRPDVDLLDVASRETLAHNGDVYLAQDADMPWEEAVAAVYRY